MPRLHLAGDAGLQPQSRERRRRTTTRTASSSGRRRSAVEVPRELRRRLRRLQRRRSLRSAEPDDVALLRVRRGRRRACSSPEKVDIGALFAAAELSMDFDWIRPRLSLLYGSGDDDPFDDASTGFDAIFENPQFAGADTSYWIRQAVPLIGGGRVALSSRNGVLASLRSSKEEGSRTSPIRASWLAGARRRPRRAADAARLAERELRCTSTTPRCSRWRATRARSTSTSATTCRRR